MPMRRESLFVKMTDSSESPKRLKTNPQSKDQVGMQKVLLKDIIKAQAFSRFFNAQLNAQKLQQESMKTFTDAYKYSRSEITQFHKKYKDFIKICFPNLQIVNVLHQGDSFGEIALLTNSQRTATVVCSQDTHLMTLHKKEFQSILDRYRYQIQLEKIQMLKSFPLFEAMSNNAILNLIENMAIGNLKMFEVIFQEGQTADYIYIIKEGQVEIDAYQSDKYQPTDEFEKLRKLNTLKNFKRQRISLALLQAGCQFGHEDILQNRLRETRAIAKSSSCELFMIPAKVRYQQLQKNEKLVKNAAKQGKVNKILQSNQEFEEIHQKAIQIQKQIVKQNQKKDEKLQRFVSSVDLVNREYDTRSYDKKQLEFLLMIIRLVQSSKNVSQKPKYIDYYARDFDEEFDYVSRMNIIPLSKQLTRKKKKLLRQNKGTMKSQQFEPIFPKEYFQSNERSQRSCIQSQKLRLKPKQQSLSIDDHTSYHSMKKLFSNVFKGHQELEKVETIFQNPNKKLSMHLPFVEDYAKIELGFQIHEKQQISFNNSPKKMHEVINIHTRQQNSTKSMHNSRRSIGQHSSLGFFK